MGRIAARRLHDSLDGGVWDDFHARRILEVVFAKAGRVQALEPVLSLLQDLREPNLFASTRDQVLDHIDEVVLRFQQGTLDLVVRTCARRAVVSGSFRSDRDFIAEVVSLLLERFIVDGKGGLRELRGEESLREMRQAIRQRLAPVIEEAATSFETRPTGTLRGLTKQQRLTTTSDLLGGAVS